MEEWYKEAIIYELHVKCFYDSSGDGIGDFKGLTQKLDYLVDLGITAVWLLPFYPSPLRDDGYDISNYTDVHPHYGLLKDFKLFLKEAHQRGLKVITELVINHTSDQHPWFQRARKKGASHKEADFYVWSDNPNRYKEARIIFQDFEGSNWSWDREAGRYYWHRFYSHQPDLNFENPLVEKAIFTILSFWFDLGVDGLRLDAIPYLFEREGTVCENLPETHAFLKRLRGYVDAHFKDRMLLAEANQWPEDAAKYFGGGDECHTAFHFPLMPRLFMSIHLEDWMPIIDIMEQTPEIPENCQWVLFLRNHDELTLEMVTDEERDYMFHVYATDPQARLNLGIRRRLAPLLKNDRRKIELMNVLLFSMHGTPALYYGDELGMGDNIYLGDRNGVRTPMQWSNDRNAGFSKANPQQLYLPPIIDPQYHYETVNVEAQFNNPHSLLHWTKQLIALRKRFKAFSFGTTQFLITENRKVLVFFRKYKEELILIVANLSRSAQYVELDLKEYQGYSLVEMFSDEHFPSIGELPYFLTLGAYGYYWFSLEKQVMPAPSVEKHVPTITWDDVFENLFQPGMKRKIETLLATFLSPKISKRAKSKVHLFDYLPIDKRQKIYLVIVQIQYDAGFVDHFPLFLAPISEEDLPHLQEPDNHHIAWLQSKKGKKMLCVLDQSPLLVSLFSEMIHRQKKVIKDQSVVRGILCNSGEKQGLVRAVTQTQEEIDSDIEIRRFLTEKTDFKGFIPVLGYLIYESSQKIYLGIEEPAKENPLEQNARQLFVEGAGRFLQGIETLSEPLDKEQLVPLKTWVELATQPIPEKIQFLLAEQTEWTRLLAEETAKLHLALCSSSLSIDFAPVGYTLFHQRSMYQNMRKKALEALARLKKMRLLEGEHPFYKQFLESAGLILKTPLTGLRIRHHGNFILDNLVYTGKEFLISGFGGRADLSKAERKYKRSALRDVASLIYSITHAGFDAADKWHAQGLIPDRKAAQEKAFCWSIWMSVNFLSAYLQKTQNFAVMPKNMQELDFLITLFLFELCFDEIKNVNNQSLDTPLAVICHGYHLMNRLGNSE